MALGTPIAVILPSYAVIFVLAVPLVSRKPYQLLRTGTVILVVGSVVVLGLRQLITGSVGSAQPTLLVGEFVTGTFPALAWMGHVLIGVALGKLPLTSAHLMRRLVVFGVVAAVVGYGGGATLTALFGDTTGDWPNALFSVAPHSTSPFEMIGNAGVAATALGVCLLLAHTAGGLVAPVAAVGTMPLTVYCGHILIVDVLGPEVVRTPVSNVPLMSMAAGALLFASLWRAAIGRGPLENIVRTLSRSPVDA
jgi:uncharacterized membrane protein YeiB